MNEERIANVGSGEGLMNDQPTVRLATETDAEAIAHIYAPIVAETVISFEVEPPSPAEMAQRIRSTLILTPWVVCGAGYEVWGYAYASKHRERAAYQWSVDVSVYVDERRRRHGVGRALYLSLFALLRLQGFYAAHAGITLPNPASVGIHEALGFQPVGVYRSVGYKNGAWHDVGWWQLPLRERTGTPAAPVPVTEASRNPGWTEAMSCGRASLRV
jgi:L-amino acid N-acyltransferase YncA